MLQFSRLAAVFLVVLIASVRGGPWPEVKSDLEPDPAIRWGVLPNGLRYAVRHNAEPKARASLRFLVAAGSIDERESERGIAHFIEHMAFRGTRKHPNGELNTELQRLGMGFGPDTAAFTFVDHTIYQLELPDVAPATLKEGLGVFREYAEDITFDAGLIDRERDVILNERDTRDTPNSRAGDANFDLLFPDAQQGRRKPIGLAENIRGFARDQFVAFYDAWYRPERMVVVAVGDFDPDAMVGLITAALGGMEGRGVARPDLFPLAPGRAGRPNIGVFVDSGMIGAECMMEHPFPEPASPDTHARRVEQLRRAMAFAMLQRRTSRLSKNADERFVVPMASVNSPVAGWAVASFGATGRIDNWKAFMGELEVEHRRAYTYGFTAEELAMIRTSFAAGYDDAVRTYPTWPSDWIAGSIAESVVKGVVSCTPMAIRSDLMPSVASATPADCLAAYRHAWTAQSMHVFVAANPVFKVTRAEVADALNASRATPVTKPADVAPAVFAYTHFGAPGRVARSEQLKDLDAWEAGFANGVKLNFKPTSFDANSVFVNVRVGTGRLSQPVSKPGLDLLANGVVSFGGVGKHSSDQLIDVLAGHSLSIGFQINSDSLDFSARCEPKDLELCLQVIAAQLTDSAYRDEALIQANASLGSMYASLSAAPDGPIVMQSLRVLSGGDSRFGTATADEVGKRTIAEVRDWIDPQLKGGPVEVSVVGDTTWEAASGSVAATLGALPERRERSEVVSSETLHAPQAPKKPAYISTTAPSLRQVAIAWFCPIADLDGIHMERRCRMLAALIEERMRVRLRMELGAAYGFEAQFASVDGFPDLSYFRIATVVAPEHAQRANELIKEEIEALRKGHFTDDEFTRIRLPLLSKREEDLRSNGYWCYTVLRDAQQRPSRIAAARDREADYAAINRADLEKLAAKYFDAGRWFQFVAFPSVRSAPPRSAPAFFGSLNFEKAR